MACSCAHGEAQGVWSYRHWVQAIGHHCWGWCPWEPTDTGLALSYWCLSRLLNTVLIDASLGSRVVLGLTAVVALVGCLTASWVNPVDSDMRPVEVAYASCEERSIECGLYILRQTTRVPCT